MLGVFPQRPKRVVRQAEWADCIVGTVGGAEDDAVGGVEGTLEGYAEGTLEGDVEGTPEGDVEGTPEGGVENTLEDTLEGALECALEGGVEDMLEGGVEDTLEGILECALVGGVEGTLEGEAVAGGVVAGNTQSHRSSAKVDGRDPACTSTREKAPGCGRESGQSGQSIPTHQSSWDEDERRERRPVDQIG